MTQRAVERTLGKLLTDETFRGAFFEDPSAAALQAGLDLSREELEALARVPRALLSQLGGSIDDRICRLHVPAPAAHGGHAR